MVICLFGLLGSFYIVVDVVILLFLLLVYSDGYLRGVISFFLGV